jgi:hypothetical protein
MPNSKSGIPLITGYSTAGERSAWVFAKKMSPTDCWQSPNFALTTAKQPDNRRVRYTLLAVFTKKASVRCQLPEYVKNEN